MSEWHLPPEYINQNWTEELLALMFHKRNLRIERWNEMAEGKVPEPRVKRRVSDTELFSIMGLTVQRGGRA